MKTIILLAVSATVLCLANCAYEATDTATTTTTTTDHLPGEEVTTEETTTPYR